jgi:hypothetical protein
LSPPEHVFASDPPAPKATETLDSRVRRLTQILAIAPKHAERGSSHDESAAAAALRNFSAVLPSVQQLAQEVRSRVGAGDWDAGDVLAARLLLQALTSALRSCRVVSDEAAARLHDFDRTFKAGHMRLRRESRKT